MRVVILVPRRNDNGHRDKLWAYCRQKWLDWDDPLPIYEGHHDDGPFNRSAAINSASAMADSVERWDVALIIDSDTVSNHDSVWEAIRYADQTGGLAVAHTQRHMMTERATKDILSGNRKTWKRGSMIERTWRDSVSCAIAIKRSTWDAIGGFDERFEGWGFEDTAFHFACETIIGLPIKKIPGDCYHLWHPPSPETSRSSPTYLRNHILRRRYESVRWQPDRLLRLLGRLDEETPSGTIPRILHRTVPAETTAQVEAWWVRFAELHPDWDLRTYREPIDPSDWPITGHLFDRCQNGAQKAGLIRLEALFTVGGIYVDSDVIPHRPFDSLLSVPAFAAWEDKNVVPDAVLGSAPGHQAFMLLLERARECVERGDDAWVSGPGGTTEILPDRDDVLLLPPGAFYPVHYLERSKLGKKSQDPWVFCEHQWHHSWGTDEQKKILKQRQRPGRHARTRPISGVPAVHVPAVMPDDILLAVCIPWNGTEDEWRRLAYDWCIKYWREAGFTIFEGNGPSRSAMRNHAAKQALDWGANMLFFADADTWVPIEQVIAAAITARDTGQVTHAYSTYTRLTSSVSKHAYARANVSADTLSRQGQRQRGHMSGASAVPVKLWERIGGYDERYMDWGYEDRSFDLAAGCIGGGIQRVVGPAIHWFHGPSVGKGKRRMEDDAVMQLVIRYFRAAAITPGTGRAATLASKYISKDDKPDPDAMMAILSEPGGPLSGATASWGPPVLEK